MECRVPGCLETENLNSIGLCPEHTKYYEYAYKHGVYRIEFKGYKEFYIGKATEESIKTRISKHKNALINGTSKCILLLNFFNKVCSEHSDLTKKEVFKKYVIYKKIYPELEFIEPLYDGATKKDFRDANIRMLPEFIEKFEWWKKNCEREESELIKKAHQEDKKNNTNYCLNKIN